MSQFKSIERVCKETFYNARILLKYGTSSPGTVTLPKTDTVLHINPHDYRARKIILTNCCVRGRIPRNQRFWRMAVNALQPTTALDVGLNYGECLLSMVYPDQTDLFAIEANQNLKKYIDQSIAAHPNREQIKCLFQLATDKIEQSEFWVNPSWSGGSTAATPVGTTDESKYEKTTVTSTTVDHILQSHHANQETLFFKVDVEGFEYRVLLGMQETLTTTTNAVGMIEFDPAYLQRAGEDVEEFWAFLRKTFRVYAFDQQDQWHDCQDRSLSALQPICGKSFHTDLILVKADDAEAVIQRLHNRWLQIAAERLAA